MKGSFARIVDYNGQKTSKTVSLSKNRNSTHARYIAMQMVLESNKISSFQYTLLQYTFLVRVSRSFIIKCANFVKFILRKLRLRNYTILPCKINIQAHLNH